MFNNGAYINPDYTGRDYLLEYTWNWYVPSGSFQSGAMQFGYDYSEVSSSIAGNLAKSTTCDNDLPGISIEVQKNLGQWNRFGVDAFASSGEVYRRVDTVRNGTYVTSVEIDQAMADWALNPDGSLCFWNI